MKNRKSDVLKQLLQTGTSAASSVSQLLDEVKDTSVRPRSAPQRASSVLQEHSGGETSLRCRPAVGVRVPSRRTETRRR